MGDSSLNIMFPQHRQSRLDPVLSALRLIPGVAEVTQDDFDSSSINVFIRLDDDNSRYGSMTGDKPYRFAQPLFDTTVAIKQALHTARLDFRFLNQPRMTHVRNGGKRIRDGYSTDSYKVEVFC